MAASTSTAPAGGIKSFFLLTQDAANDPLNGHISMDYLTVDPNNRGGGDTPVVIKQNLTTLFNMGAVTPVGVVGPNGCSMHALSCCRRQVLFSRLRALNR
eukprot:scaffold383_cov131-Skeletonema_marinoi.AAC.14